MISSGMLQAFNQIFFQELSDVVVTEQHLISQSRIRDNTGRAVVLQGPFGDAQSLAELLALEDVEGAPATLYRRSFP